MATYKLSIDEFDEVNYELIAIHTSLEDYHLAYFINQKLPVLLSKNKHEIHVSNKAGETSFSRFTFEEPETCETWDLLQNKNEVFQQTAGSAQDLFGNPNSRIAARAYLLPEFKKVDYFLRIENSEINTEKLISELNDIQRISTIYTVNVSQIKSKNNLIF